MGIHTKLSHPEKAGAKSVLVPIENGPGGPLVKALISLKKMVPRGGVEPPTLRFSIACSTN
jgi:hypothetical protein